MRMIRPLQGEVLTKGIEVSQPAWWPRREGQRDTVSQTKATGNSEAVPGNSEWLSDEPEKGGGGPEALLGNP